MNTRAMQHLIRRLLPVAGIVAWNLLSSIVLAAPLPQKITNPRLQRHDCLDNPENTATDLMPYIQEFLFTDQQAGLTLYSCINWQTGFLKSEGIGKKGSMRAAELVARNNALKTLLVTNLNATSQFDAYFSRQKQVSLKIQNVLIKNAVIEELPPDSTRPDEAKVMATLPFYGISGLTSFLVGDQELYLEPLPVPAQSERQPAAPSEEFTGIIFDVRRLPQMQPALLPNIVSEDGDILYDASHVEKSVFETQGMIHYVQANDPKLSSLLGERPLIVTPLIIASTSNDMAVFSLLAQAQQRRRHGNNLTVSAANSAGQIPVNVVVSMEDAKKIKQLNETQQLDKEGRYTILIGGEIGGVKGEVPTNFSVCHVDANSGK
ncbi:hypothetical protein U14_00829 [Candidatus Moduliflexus flocculans]|uniref:Uncharacterized protein n=1 Tax=Candidatus Moduliflexus flocculans TaxID=1499966 RepID=A0A0S6VWQ5_9BACT|nr:hypothetical protein U14_00829 [Candidatus Moduliflexus flocculans]